MNSTNPPRTHFTLRYVHAITGTFLLACLATLVVIVVLAARSQRWFIGNVNLSIALPEAGAAGIRRGSEVYFLGTLMGTVSDVSVDPAGRMEAQVNIRRDFFRFVRADSSAVVKRKFGMVGDAYFEISRGHGKTLPEKNAEIICNALLPSALESAVEEVRSEAVPALQELRAGLRVWTTLGSNMVATSHRLDQLVARVDDMAEQVQEGKGAAGKILADPATALHFQRLLTSADGALDDLRGVLATFQQASANLQLASANLPFLSDTLAAEAKDLPGLALQTQISMRELEHFIGALQRHWLFRKYMKKPDPTRTAPQSRQ
ncbi:MAG TPA: MlaD family protein [Methylomirabilota bacterium]|nr:MlaD family protein [Methylomirabilota bacterium]